MIRKLIGFLILCFFLSNTGLSQSSRITGSVPEYAGTKLSFLTFADQITYAEKELCSCQVNENGDFSCLLNVTETTYVFLHLGIYEAFIFVEPGKNYQIFLPEKQEKTMADQLNPYFEPIQYHLGIENSSENELNYQLAFFDEIYSKMFESTSYAIYSKNSNLDVNAEIARVDSIFSDFDNKYFKDFKKYKYASYRHLANNAKSKSISNTYYLNNQILYSNPAYMGLFNQVYKEYFQYFGRTESGKKIYSDIGKYKSITLLKETLGQDSILANDTLKELVILKCLHDEFYNDLLSRSAMLTVIDSLALQTKIDEHKQIAANIRDKVSKLMVGYAPPDFQLYDKDSNLVTLDSFKGEYIYLSFCTTVSYACIKEFEMLRNLYENHKDHFEIVIICLDETLAQMKQFVERKGYPYTFLHYGNQSEVFKEYDIRAFPTYYFIDKEGKLVLSPAPSPDQNAEFTIYKIMKAKGDI